MSTSSFVNTEQWNITSAVWPFKVTVAVSVTSATGWSAAGSVTFPELSMTSGLSETQVIVAAPPHAVDGSVTDPSVMVKERLPSSPLVMSKSSAASKSAFSSSLMASPRNPAASSSLRAVS